MSFLRVFLFMICKIFAIVSSTNEDYPLIIRSELRDVELIARVVPGLYESLANPAGEASGAINHRLVKRDLDGPGLYYYKYLKEREKMKSPYTPKQQYRYNKRHPFRGSTKKLRSNKNSAQDSSWTYLAEPVQKLKHPTGSPELYAIFPHLTPKRFYS